MSHTSTVQDIGIIILAAGSSQRFNGDKRQAMMKNGKCLLENTLANIPASFTQRVLVLHKDDEALISLFKDQWQICIAEQAHLGMGFSLAKGIQQANSWSAALIGLGDMPLVQTQTYSSLQQALCKHEIVAPIYKQQRGNPVGFKAQYFEELAALNQDKGARSLLKKYHQQCYWLDTEDEGILKDIDTKDSLNNLV